jgi:hypothetical protein
MLARVSSVEERTSDHIVRLEIGVPMLGTQFENKDLPVVIQELVSLRALKLYYCHLIDESAYHGCVGLP